ncbi:hypothetical protein AS202_18805 [Myroides odoratimimus]|uniref:Uncharacterized protein n=1 Tax=Myroides odoratimimus TaxID=76832 RepID=A0AAI8G6H1_9FLAO|nr:hypothetical protein AS202_18805 [Myroides odoratimimus]
MEDFSFLNLNKNTVIETHFKSIFRTTPILLNSPNILFFSFFLSAIKTTQKNKKGLRILKCVALIYIYKTGVFIFSLLKGIYK